MPILEAQGLVKSYRRRRVVNGVDLLVERGEIVGLLGPNGAGKTTSFRMICGMIDPDEGSVRLNGQDVTSWPMHRRAADGGMGYLAQESSVFRKLTVEQNLLAMMELLGVGRKERKRRCTQLLEQFEKMRKIQNNQGKTIEKSWQIQKKTKRLTNRRGDTQSQSAFFTLGCAAI